LFASGAWRVREVVVDHYFVFAPFVSLLRAFHNNHKPRFTKTQHATQKKEEERLQGQAQTSKGKKMNSKKVSKFELPGLLLACTRC
jgi:hypothetical protein